MTEPKTAKPFYLVLDFDDGTVKHTRVDDSEADLPDDELPVIHDNTQWMELRNNPENRAALRAALVALEQDADETVESSLLQHAEAFGLTKTESWENPDTSETCSAENPDGTQRITIHSEVTE
jgi:hypothetical protein